VAFSIHEGGSKNMLRVPGLKPRDTPRERYYMNVTVPCAGEDVGSI